MILKNDDGKPIELVHNEILGLIPHRHLFLLIDNITDIDKRVLGFHIVTNHYDKYVTKETNKTAYKQSNKPAHAFRCILFAK